MMDPSRIEAAYSAAVFSEAAAAWQKCLVEHYDRVSSGQGPVLNWQEPSQAIAEAGRWLSEPLWNNGQSVVQNLAVVLGQILKSGQNLHHPHYIGHQVPASVPMGGLLDAISSLTNQVMAIYEMGPWSTAVEHALVSALCEKVPWDRQLSSGLLTHGGSLANLTALLTARNVSIPDSWENGVPADTVLVTHPDAHYCVTRSAGILGLGSKQVIRASANELGQMDPGALDTLLTSLTGSGLTVMAVSSCACSTPTGTFDALNDVAEVCERHNIWLHVDAAHGGGLLMSRTHRHLLDGLHRADSVVWDAHKMLFVPALCAAVLYRNREHRFETFYQDAPYLFDPSAPGMADIDSGMRTIECTKRGLGFGLWGLWVLFGEQLFEDLVDRTIAGAQYFHSLLTEASDFETLHDPQCNIVAFRYLPESLQGLPAHEIDRAQREIRTRLIRSGEFYIVQTTLRRRAALRVTVMNPLTTEDDFRELLDAIRKTYSLITS
jgi:L-2,4-diaminobutyrate decarboxylase